MIIPGIGATTTPPPETISGATAFFVPAATAAFGATDATALGETGGANTAGAMPVRAETPSAGSTSTWKNSPSTKTLKVRAAGPLAGGSFNELIL
jgi:hypothetical protein